MADTEEGGGDKLLMRLLQNSDLFGGDSDSDPDTHHSPVPSPHGSHTSDQIDCTRPYSPDGDSQPAKKKKKMKEKTGRERKPKRLKKTEVQQIHSDSQRMVRESSLNLPKYQPRARDLNSFLTKVRSRKPLAAPAVVSLKTRGIEDIVSLSVASIDKENGDSRTSDDVTPPSSFSVDTPINDPDKAIENTDSPTTNKTENTNVVNCHEDSFCHEDNSILDPPQPEDNIVPDRETEVIKRDEDLSFSEVTPLTPPHGTPPPSDSDGRSALTSKTIKEIKSSSKSSYPKQSTITSLFAKPHPSTDSTPRPAESAGLGNSQPPLPNPQLSSLDDFLFEKDDKLTAEVSVKPERKLTPLEKFQQRLDKHLTVPHPVVKVKVEKGQGSLEEDDVSTTPLVSEELAAKLVDQPGAIRQHWREAIRQQLSQRRAKERKAVEEIRKMCNEEVEEEEEYEMTDAETSDEEFVQGNNAAAEESDVCSDLDEDEGVKLASSNQNTDAVEQESTNQDSDDEQDFNSDSEDDIGGPLVSQRTHHFKKKSTGLRILDSDEEDEEVQNKTETQAPNANIVNSMWNPVSESTSISVTQSTGHDTLEQSTASTFAADHSVSMFSSSCTSRTSGPKFSAISSATEKASKFNVFRRPSVLFSPEEASMPPLVLNASSDSEDSNNSLNDRGIPTYVKKPIDDGSVLQATKDFVSSDTAEVSPGILQSTGAESAFELPPDSGIGCTVNDKPFYEVNDDSQLTLELEDEDGSVDESVGPTVSERDNSLEMSFRWPDGPSLPPAQPRRENSLELFNGEAGKRKNEGLGFSEETFDPQSQWEEAQAASSVSMATNAQSLESQDMSVDEQTQFLDADGFLCLRKEKRPTHSSSAIKGSLDSTQPGSPSEILNLCSGQFTNTQGADIDSRPSALASVTRRRHPSDSSSTQGVRELLGLSMKPRSVGISGLLSLGEDDAQVTKSNHDSAVGFGMGGSGRDFSQLNEVIGLCSGVFPQTQAQEMSSERSANGKELFPSKKSTSGTSDGHTSDSSCEDEPLTFQMLKDGSLKNNKDRDSAVLQWAEKQRQLRGERGTGQGEQGRGYYGDNENEDDDMPLIKRRSVKLKHKPTKGERLAEFVDSEAELSGDDVGSDIDEDDEILAEEEAGLFGYEEDGDQSDVPLSEHELWDQVNKAHMKETLADDKADLRDIKERFLKEGDLFEDGLALKNGFFRSRHFAKQGSEAGSLDLFSEDHGEIEVEGREGEELSSQAEAKRRKDRLEREEFMIKCRERDGGLLAMDDDSQSILSIIVDNSSQSMVTTPLPVKPNHIPKLTTPSLSIDCKRTRGSFLKHNSSTLRRLSSLTSATPKSVGGANGHGFIFHKKQEPVVKKTDNMQTKKSVKRNLPTTKERTAKRPKLDRSLSGPSDTERCNQSLTGSIFSVLK